MLRRDDPRLRADGTADRDRVPRRHAHCGLAAPGAALTGLILLALATCTAPADRTVVGFWESTARGSGGFGHTLEFKADGSFLSSLAVLVELVYRFDGSRLLTAGDATALTSETDGPRVVIQGDALVLTDAKGGTIRKERVGPVEDRGHPIVGIWRYKHDTGPMAYERYTPDGRLLFRLPLSSSPGCYTLSAGTLTVMPERTAAATFTPRIEGDELELRRDIGPPTRYRRVPAAWYPRQ